MHWLFHILGLDNASGVPYLFWSGFGSDMGELTAIAVIYRRFACHEQRCYRLGLHHNSGRHLCRRHMRTDTP